MTEQREQLVEERLVSIIVPVYNAQHTLERCIESILAQTWRNIEVIAVDDGSGDGSGGLLDAFAAKDARLRVVHTDNRGVSAARNTGLSLARGAYIGFADADDWMEPDMVRQLAGWLEREQADIAVCGWELHAAGNGSQRTGTANAEAIIMTPQEAKRHIAAQAELDKRLTAVFEAAGIARAVTEASRKLYARWHEAWGLSHDVILLAAEISSLSENPYRYLSTLLSNWHEAGVKTLADAQRETKKRGSRRLAAGAKPVDFAHPEEDYDRLAVNLFEDEGA